MKSELTQRHAVIWHQEQVFAYRLAQSVISKPKVTVWMIMLPLLFLFFLHDLKKYKSGIRNFAEGFLKNKKAALDLAFTALNEETALDRAMATYAVDSRPNDARKKDLHATQMQEIACLATHFHRLLSGKGNSYDVLVKEAYDSIDDFERFQNKLFTLEQAVVDSAMRVESHAGDAQELVLLMQNATRHWRRQTADRIFRD